MAEFSVSKEWELNDELTVETIGSKKLVLLKGELSIQTMGGRKVLRRNDDGTTLPGEPLIHLNGKMDAVLLDRVGEAFKTPELDEFAPNARRFTTPSSSYIFPIHFQPARGHEVIPTENPKLHLVWYKGRIFIKPIPRYLLSAAFWEWIIDADREGDIFRAAAGFMRTYTYLIKSESDYRLAVGDDKTALLPTDTDASREGFERFLNFIHQFTTLDDSQVTPRYAYCGELSLRALNMRMLLKGSKLTYFHMHREWGTVIMGSVFPVLVAIFALPSTFLTAMQVGLAVDALREVEAYVKVCYGFSVAILVTTGLATLIIVLVFIGNGVREKMFANRMAKATPDERKEMRTGVV